MRQDGAVRLAECLGLASPDEVPVAVPYLSGVLPQGTIGVGWAALRQLPDAAPPPPTLQLLEVDAAVSRIAAISGAGSQAARRDELAALFGRATEPEQRFLTGLLLGELRQGALEGVMVEAVAKAAGIPATEVRRAAMLAGDLGPVAEAMARTGSAAVEWKFDGARVQVHRLGSEVRAFTRNLADMTDRVPEVVQA